MKGDEFVCVLVGAFAFKPYKLKRLADAVWRRLIYKVRPPILKHVVG